MSAITTAREKLAVARAALQSARYAVLKESVETMESGGDFADDNFTTIALFTKLEKDVVDADAYLGRQVEKAFDPKTFSPPDPRPSQAELDAISGLVHMRVPKATATSIVQSALRELAAAGVTDPEFDPLFRKSMAAAKQL